MNDIEGPLPALAYWGLIGSAIGAVAGVILRRQFRGAVLGMLLGIFVGAAEYERSRARRPGTAARSATIASDFHDQ